MAAFRIIVSLVALLFMAACSSIDHLETSSDYEDTGLNEYPSEKEKLDTEKFLEDFLRQKQDIAAEATLLRKCLLQIEQFRQEFPFPEYFGAAVPEKRGGEFDVNEYFKVFKHLKMQEGYTLDYVYYFQGLGGRPVLYARKLDDKPFKTHYELVDSFRKEANIDEVEAIKKTIRELDSKILAPPFPLPNAFPEDAKSAQDQEKIVDEIDKLKAELEKKYPNRNYEQWFLEHIKIDGTRQSYLELIAFRITAEQFYLYWHGEYNDSKIICTRADAARIIRDYKIKISNEQDFLRISSAEEFKNLDVRPSVEEKENNVITSMVTFTKWGGFSRKNYSVSKKFPHKITKLDDIILVQYDCGLLF